jgi:hypothetical protein
MQLQKNYFNTYIKQVFILLVLFDSEYFFITIELLLK